ncbi:hypothetical protein PTTG_29161 [Puccinia triticina 1-1 BBBD Race 1]|uniref:Uncharacterized protein n=2 Tax=Puccinia triticina TaxID=208348 RepID=A0A180G5X0_PUCT1|nr:uncharacterized protein PtA15_10A598 [Puccinia triticina]OAV88071.1 hypothetical protein PTTG_29161 [Puccinia triticina 1-1 BBBD Race 1]WAQ89174.1 hypothetical protein PtA15_10A598 [Puccinia triticina]
MLLSAVSCHLLLQAAGYSLLKVIALPSPVPTAGNSLSPDSHVLELLQPFSHNGYWDIPNDGNRQKLPSVPDCGPPVFDCQQASQSFGAITPAADMTDLIIPQEAELVSRPAKRQRQAPRHEGESWRATVRPTAESVQSTHSLEIPQGLQEQVFQRMPTLWACTDHSLRIRHLGHHGTGLSTLETLMRMDGQMDYHQHQTTPPRATPSIPKITS